MRDDSLGYADYGTRRTLSSVISIKKKTIVAITPGDPAGIGPDIAIQASTERRVFPVVHYCDPTVIANRASALDIPVQILILDNILDATSTDPNVIQIFPIRVNVPVAPGVIDPENSPYVLSCLDSAIEDCAGGRASAIVTGPVNKAGINNKSRPKI